MAAISIRNLDVVFGKRVSDSLALLDRGMNRQQIIEQTGVVVGVHNASLEIGSGEICVLMGLSGSGKSSLLRAINGLNKVSRGELLIDDKGQTVDVASCPPATLRHLRTCRVSMVFQRFALMPWLTVEDNVAFGLEMQNESKSVRRARAREKLELVGLLDWKDSYPHELSGGMQQRVGLARAFAMDSDILLMDEPFSALDPLIRNQLQDELLELQRRLNKTIVFVSHDLDEALKIGTHIAIMDSARIIQHGRPEDIVLNPCNDYVKNFVAHTNPLNVLRGRSLMTGMDALERLDQRVLLNKQENTWLQLNEVGQLLGAGRHERPLRLHEWTDGDGINALAEDTLVVASPDISMREAIEIRYKTGHPIVLREHENLVGILSDRDFYHALLGKHFSSTSIPA
uniref:choline ABC transporter ATP-binding protein n=1 Tax=Marinobacterium profundum TaxID=1714300 RepID=UPI000836E3F9|nr:choline ABC transporter ATP-binding protein [Marinobacterium profundum]